MLENPLTLLRRLPEPVRLLIVRTFINKLGTFILPYLTIVLQRDFALGASEVGQLLFAAAESELGLWLEATIPL